MNWEDLRIKLEPAKDWIIFNQLEDGSIPWDEKGKCDPWDHCECLIALAIYKEWDAFDKGLAWFFNNINKDGLISPEFKNQESTQHHFESHHAPYVALPIMQARLMGRNEPKIDEFESKLENIFDNLKNFKDKDGYYFWAKDKNGYSDNSLITATMSIFLSLKALNNESSIDLDLKKWNEKFDRDGVDRSRFSMDFYYPYLAGIKKDKNEFKLNLKNFYKEGLGVKCVEEEPWVTIAESSECIIAALVVGEEDTANKIFKNIMQFQDPKGVFPTGYQYDLKIFWPEEKSTWTNAALIIAAHAISNYKDRKGDNGNIFLHLNGLLKSDQTIHSTN
jgi:hypothetical protein|tara:strand:- start:391 stop:1392 length:1002 start_codon:yes stop_codon:yes gene_type:complete